MNSSILIDFKNLTFRAYLDGSVMLISNNKHKTHRIFGSPEGKGYRKFITHQNGKTVRCLVHRIIAEAFWENLENLPEVDHIDRNRSNNNALNLRFADRSSNASNTLLVENALKRDGFRYRDDPIRYNHLHCIQVVKPNGKNSRLKVTPEQRDIVINLSGRERYFKIKELREAAHLQVQTEAQ